MTERIERRHETKQQQDIIRKGKEAVVKTSPCVSQSLSLCLYIPLPTPTTCIALPLSYHLLQGVDEVLQVDVLSVGLDVGQEEVVDTLSDVVLEDELQHGHSQFQEED